MKNKSHKIQRLLHAMRADNIPRGNAGLWHVTKQNMTEEKLKTIPASQNKGMPPVGRYTVLHRKTMATLLKPIGEIVMNDYPSELVTHLDFVLKARGKVLITGLGLGCVVRGCLANGQVESIDVVERDPDVIALCKKGVDDPRVTIHQMDALRELPPGQFDYAWNDLWSDTDKGEKRLAENHLDLMFRMLQKRKAKKIGCWQARPYWKRLIPDWI